MRHFMDAQPHSARLACGPAIYAYFPMENKALGPAGIGKIDVAVNWKNVTCERCLRKAPADGEKGRET